jgi:hypothetical protein
MMEMECLLAKLEDKMNANAKANQEDLLARMDNKQANMKADQARMETKLDSNQGRMAKFERKMEETMEHQLQYTLSHINRSTQILPEVKTVPDPRMMPSMEEHQDIPTEDIAVMPVREPRK